MDVFIEKIVTRKKKTEDYLIITGIVLAALILLFIIPVIPYVNTMWFFFAAVVIFGVFFLVRSRNIEYEYSVTNGELDIDMIIAQRKRKRIFNGNCREFDIVAKLQGGRYSSQINNINKRIEAVSSMDSPDVYFTTVHYKGEKVAVFFEPDKRMLDAFKALIPRKVFEY